MGIRFRCPNGHKIHVKAFLAGKRGICPECGIRVPIPAESDPEFSGGATNKALDQNNPSKKGAAATRAKSLTAGAARQPADRPPGRSVERTSNASPNQAVEPPRQAVEPAAERPASQPPAEPMAPVSGSIAGGRADSTDPIAAAPNAKWFVRPPTGGQFGPAPSHVLREWISDGRVTPESYVWREGWSEWRKAKDVLGKLEAARSNTDAPNAGPSIVAQSDPKSTTELYRRRKSTKTTATVVVLLGLACAVLFAALVYVVRFMK